VGTGSFLTLVLLGTAGIWPTNADVAEQAATAFHAGVQVHGDSDLARSQFRKAAALYAELRRRGVDNALLSRNLGRAQLLAGDLPSAILSFHHGLDLSPGNRKLENDLEAARSQVMYREDHPLGRPVRPPSWSHLRAGEWLLGATLAWVLAWVSGTRWWMIGGGWRLAVAATALGIAGLLGLLGLMTRQSEMSETRPLVVIATPEGVQLRKGPGWRTIEKEPAYPPRYQTPLVRGVEGRLLSEHGEWLRIELATGEVGWVPASVAARDAP
jgi:hypothetical protein